MFLQTSESDVAIDNRSRSIRLVAFLSKRKSVTVSDIMTLIELVGRMLIIAGRFRANSEVVTRLPDIPPASGDIDGWVGHLGTTLTMVFALIGFIHLVDVAEEIKNPSHTLPWALFVTLGLMELVYVGGQGSCCRSVARRAVNLQCPLAAGLSVFKLDACCRPSLEYGVAFDGFSYAVSR